MKSFFFIVLIAVALATVAGEAQAKSRRVIGRAGCTQDRCDGRYCYKLDDLDDAKKEARKCAKEAARNFAERDCSALGGELSTGIFSSAKSTSSCEPGDEYSVTCYARFAATCDIAD